MAGEADEFEQGNWVRVWARVAEQRRVHPDDLVVVVHTHSGDNLIEVKRDHVTHSELVPAWAEQCTSLKRGYISPSEYVRCTRPRYHDTALPHRNRDREWTEDDGNVVAS